MKRVISTVITALILTVISSSMACAENTAPPKEGMSLWIKAAEGVTTVTEKKTVYVSEWEDLSGNDNHLTQEENKTKRATFKDNGTDLKIDNAVSFTASQYLQSPAVNYSGDASFVLYFKLRSDNAGTIFSSHSYTGETVTESGKTPFSIAVNSEKELVFEMGTYSEDLGISILDEDGNLKGYMSLYLSISGNTLYVYSSDTTQQKKFSEHQKSIELSEAPYFECYAYNLDYDNTSRMSGVQSYMAESIVYKRALDIDEINSVNEYLKLKYEFAILEKMELENEISEIKKGESVPFKVIATGSLIENETKEELKGFTISSSNPDVVSVDENKQELKAINFGTSRITISYDGLDDIVFTVNVPQVFINSPVVSGFSSGGNLKCSRTVENYDPEQKISLIAVSALYQDDCLLDVSFEKATNISEEYTFNASFDLPLKVDDCMVALMLLDADTMTPITDLIVKNNE